MVLSYDVEASFGQALHEAFDQPLLTKQLSKTEFTLPSALFVLDRDDELLILLQNFCKLKHQSCALWGWLSFSSVVRLCFPFFLPLRKRHTVVFLNLFTSYWSTAHDFHDFALFAKILNAL